MHTFGHPPTCRRTLLAVSHDFNIALIEDAAESLRLLPARHTGTSGPMGTLSFNGNKTVTTGGVARFSRTTRRWHVGKHLTTTAVPHAWEYRHDEVGYNYRLPNINAALGCAQRSCRTCWLQRGCYFSTTRRHSRVWLASP
jgi:dTDP-4-amino-4,6-dideoxygalactose transaminase